jgi:hypothetical protein
MPELTPSKSGSSADGEYDGTDDGKADVSSPVLPEAEQLPAKLSEWPEPYREAFHERAAIMEFDGGLSREEAEMLAEAALRQLFAASRDGDSR